MPMSVSTNSGTGGKIGIASTTTFVTGISAKPRKRAEQHVDGVGEQRGRRREPGDLGPHSDRVAVVEERERGDERCPNQQGARRVAAWGSILRASRGCLVAGMRHSLARAWPPAGADPRYRLGWHAVEVEYVTRVAQPTRFALHDERRGRVDELPHHALELRAACFVRQVPICLERGERAASPCARDPPLFLARSLSGPIRRGSRSSRLGRALSESRAAAAASPSRP